MNCIFIIVKTREGILTYPIKILQGTETCTQPIENIKVCNNKVQPDRLVGEREPALAFFFIFFCPQRIAEQISAKKKGIFVIDTVL